MRSYGSISDYSQSRHLRAEAAGLPPPPSLAEQRGDRQLPHLLVLVFQLPHFLPTQSPIRSFEPSSSFDHASPGTRPVLDTTSNWPSPLISPIRTGLVMWWFASISDSPPVRFLALMPGSASITLSASVDFTFSTAFTHMSK